jgi:hypothetical protein
MAATDLTIDIEFIGTRVFTANASARTAGSGNGEPAKLGFESSAVERERNDGVIVTAIAVATGMSGGAIRR